jgi:hypothetical protein
VLLAAALVAPTARAGEKDKKFDESEGFVDPRTRDLPRTHRFRLAIMGGYIRLTQASNDDGETQRFHFAPLVLDAGYQAQFARYLMARISVAAGGNVANSRNAMPGVVFPRAHFGFQGKMFGFAATYGFMATFPITPNATDGRSQSLGQPAIANNHVIGGEPSFTTRVDRVALTIALGVSGVRSQLSHYNLSGTRWYPMFTLGFGAYFDGTLRRARRAVEGPRRREGPAR